MIVYATGLAATEEYAINTPIFGLDNLVTVASVEATTEATGFPAANLANPSTALYWRGNDTSSPPADEYLTVEFAAAEVDYIAVAGHNFGSAGIPVSVEVDDGSSPQIWTPVAGLSLTPTDDAPLLFRFAPETIVGIRLKLEPGSEQPTAAVLYTGKLLVAPRGTHTDHVPINLARTFNEISGRSESGQFLGNIILGEGRQTSFALRQLTNDWYRANMDSFIETAKDTPFFFAWRPVAYPTDVGYVKLTNNPQPSWHFDTQTVAIEMQLAGFAG
jgi:hypothetical protein